MNIYMKMAIDEARKGVNAGDGGPFGAVIVKDGRVVSRAHNMVIAAPDPTAHAEITAIRLAATRLHTFSLQGCEIYSTCEPCPMCLAAIMWARISTLRYGCNRHDAAAIGFDDREIYDVLRESAPLTRLDISTSDREPCLKVFHEWSRKDDRTMY